MINFKSTNKTLFLIFITILTAISATAVEPQLKDSVYHQVKIDEVVISVNRDRLKLINSVQQVSIIPNSFINNANQGNTANLLMEQGTVAIQKSQQGGGSPMLRGFEASRVLLIIDNVRMNNPIYRSGHLQNIMTTDQGILDHMEVLFGPSSVIYGSDALGGAVHLYTRNPLLSGKNGKTKIATNLFGRYASANNEASFHGDISIGTKRFGSLTSVSFSNFGDLTSGSKRNPFLPDNDEYIHLDKYVKHIDGEDQVFVNNKKHRQRGSGYKQYDILQKILFKPNSYTSHLLNLQLSNTSDINRYDRLTEVKGKENNPKYGEWNYGPQFRFMGSYEFKGNEMLGADKTSLILAYQKVKESRHDRKFEKDILGHRLEEVDQISLSTDWIKYLRNNTLHAGIDGTLSFVNSTAHTENIQTGERLPLSTRYPDGGNHMHNIEAYFSHSYIISDKLTLQDGVRLGFSTLYSAFNTKLYPELTDAVTQNNITYSASAGLNYLPSDTWKLAFNVSTGYRVPNVDDIGKIFDSTSGMVVVPNPSLKPEQTISADINITKHIGNRFVWENVFFGTYYCDAIGLGKTTINGQDSIMYNGEKSEVFSNKNNKKAYLWGYSTNIRWNFLPCFTVDGTFNYVFGDFINDGIHTPLDHVSPVFGRVGVNYNSSNNKYFAEFYSLYNGKKPHSRYNMSGEDNIKYSTILQEKGQGTPAWFTLNLKASCRVQKNLILQVGVENILDTEYRTFASGINAPGRNFYAAIRANL
ncbi:MAG: TonB-dependent receptor [Bacteroides sp.]